jgi:hypothetical protein
MVGVVRGFAKPHGCIGFNRAGNPIEVFYNPIAEDTIKVYHAVALRPGVEEYDALDEEQTRTIPQFGPPGSGWLSRREALIAGMDDDAAAWLRVQAESAHTSVGHIINELMREKIAASKNCLRQRSNHPALTSGK